VNSSTSGSTDSHRGNAYEYRLIGLLFLTWGFVFLDRTASAFLFPVIGPALQLSNAQLGQISTLTTVGYAISAIVFGLLADRIGVKKRLLVPAVLLTGVFTALSATADTFSSLVTWRVLTGIAEGPVFPLAMSLVAAQCRSERLASNTGIINSGVSIITFIIGPALVTQIAAHAGWQWSFVLTAVPSVILAVLLAMFVDEVKPETAVRTAGRDAGNHSGFAAIALLLRNRNVVLCMLMCTLNLAGLWISYSYAPLYWVAVGKLTPERMGWLLSMGGFANLFWVLAIPWLSDRIGRKPAVIAASLASAVQLMLLFMVPGSGIAMSAQLLLGGMIGCTPVIYISVIGMESVPRRYQATACALIMGPAELLGGTIAPWAAGMIADWSSLPAAMALGAGVMFVTALIGFGLIETRRRLGETVGATVVG
jgi:predicted MFS family arabinose efflux permease